MPYQRTTSSRAYDGRIAGRLALLTAGTALLLLCSARPVAAQGDCSVPPELTLTRPDPDGVPTELTVGAYLVDLHGIDDAEQTFSADFFFVMAWGDERLMDVDGRSLAGCEVPLASVWAPRVIVLNERQ
ncbi:MAG: hypothetical protein V3W24_05255, partial [Gemmatimonadota bacterium]